MLYSTEPSRIDMQLDVSDEINRKYSDSTILADAFMSYSVIIGVDHPKNIVTNVADDVFDAAVADPQGQMIDYLVVPTNLLDDRDPGLGLGGTGTLDAINEKYPDLYQHGAEWADLVFAHENYRIYKVLRPDMVTNEMIQVVNAGYGNATLLFDNSTTGTLHKKMDNPENAITLMSEFFDDAVKNPRDHGVEYIIVPRIAVDSSGSTDEILRAYPELMESGLDWTELVYENELYRMYRVLYPDETETGGAQTMARQQAGGVV